MEIFFVFAPENIRLIGEFFSFVVALRKYWNSAQKKLLSGL